MMLLWFYLIWGCHHNCNVLHISLKNGTKCRDSAKYLSHTYNVFILKAFILLVRIKLFSCLASAATPRNTKKTPQNTKKTPFRKQEDSGGSKPTSDVVFTSEGASISLGPSSSTRNEETQNSLETGCNRGYFHCPVSKRVP